VVRAEPIAALYETSKLRDQKYITQRMYETALFIEAVMRGEGGIEILSDIRPAFDENLASAVNNVDPQGGWHWEGRRLVRTDEKKSDFAGDEMQKISEQLESLEKESKPGRYFWGAGYITAKKVRFLHASMRYMLQFPERFPMLQKARPKDGKFDSLAEAHGSSLKPWDVKNKGIPINQEQEAFALLTFSYTIVEGLDKWGCGLTREEEVAYLHLWKVVGYLMGVQEELLSDQPDECRSLMKKILEREGASTENGYIMTQALINWLKDYLPPTLGMDEYLSPYLMKWQMGDQAALVIPAKEMAKTNVLWRKTIFYGVINFLRGYNRINSYLMRRHGGAPSPMFKMIYESTLLIIHSLRSAYERRPYYVPVNPTQWMRSYGATPAFMQRLLIWRRSMFNTLGFGVGLAIFARCLFVATVGLAIFDCWRETVLAGVAGLLAYFLSHAVLYRKLPGTYESRPKLSEQDLIISETESRTESNV